jgi:quercetin dioxygenase-like cupin family protein
MSGFRVVRTEDTELVSYGPKSDLRVLIGDEEGSTPIRTALQTCQPGYEVPIHCHPYTEFLIVLQGAAEFRIEDDGTQTVVLRKGDSVELRPGVWHSFSTIGDEVTHLMGIHVSPTRVVNYRPGVKTDSKGFRIES